jgi:hypothetical protein
MDSWMVVSLVITEHYSQLRMFGYLKKRMSPNERGRWKIILLICEIKVVNQQQVCDHNGPM